MSSHGLLRLQSICQKICSSYKFNKCILNRYINSQNRPALKNSILENDVSKTDLLNLKSSTDKDKLLFIYENPKFYYMLNGFAFVHFFCWLQFSEFSLTKMKDVQLRGNANTQILPWWQKIDFQDKTTRTLVALFSFILGFGVLTMAWLYTLRSVRMLVLHKGGDDVSIVTYGPFGINRTSKVPLDKMTTTQSRASAKVQLPIKVQGKWLYYILDTKDGKFVNPELFDFTAGMQRTLKK